MTMTLSLHDSITPNGTSEHLDYIGQSEPDRPMLDNVERDEFHLLRGKLEVPNCERLVERPRINALLDKAVDHFPATLILGRAGTGKTAIAAALAARTPDVFWYTVESTDIELSKFSMYFSAALSGSPGNGICETTPYADKKDVGKDDLALFLLRSFARIYSAGNGRPSLIVLDDVHHIFDAGWFESFFNLLLYSLPSETHLLLLSRSKPPGPLWRLRSKQMLNVLDEKVIAFNLEETESLFHSLSLPKSSAVEANQSCFGRVSKLLQFRRGDA